MRSADLTFSVAVSKVSFASLRSRSLTEEFFVPPVEAGQKKRQPCYISKFAYLGSVCGVHEFTQIFVFKSKVTTLLTPCKNRSW